MSSSRALVWLGAALIALLAGVGALQWRWLTQLGHHEHYRLDRQAGYAAWLFKEMFDHELSTLARTFDAAVAESKDPAAELARRAAAWRGRSRWPAMLKGIYRVAGGGAGPAAPPERLDAGATAFVPASWPEELEPVERWLAAAGGPVAFRDRGVLAVPAAPALIARQPEGVLVLQLDRAALGNEILPAMVESAFQQLIDGGFEVAVVEAESGAVLFSTFPLAEAASFGRADVIFGLADAGGDTRGVDLRGRPPAGDEAIPRTDRGPTPEETAWFRDFWARLFYAGQWQVMVRRGTLSIEEEVALRRRRWAATAAGLLLLLGGVLALLVVASRRVQRLAEEQLELVARVSHELRTPLAVLATTGDNLADGFVREPEQVSRYGRSIRRQTRRLREMTENVLHLARRRARTPRSQRRPVDLVAMAGDSLSLYEEELDRAGVEVEVSYPEGPVEVLGDGPALRSAVTNLVSNAIKHGGGGRWLRLAVEYAGTDGDREARVSVSDRGAGIERGDLARLFGPYYRGRRARADQIEGSGLGLALIHDVITAHGGRVTVDSRVGRGSTFTLHLPALAG